MAAIHFHHAFSAPTGGNSFMSTVDRRKFLKMMGVTAGGATAGLNMLPPAIAQALSIPPNNKTNTIMDVEHVVILMQENRSFDHYFGTYNGVRGFTDPRPVHYFSSVNGNTYPNRHYHMSGTASSPYSPQPYVSELPGIYQPDWLSYPERIEEHNTKATDPAKKISWRTYQGGIGYPVILPIISAIITSNTSPPIRTIPSKAVNLKRESVDGRLHVFLWAMGSEARSRLTLPN